MDFAVDHSHTTSEGILDLKAEHGMAADEGRVEIESSMSPLTSSAVALLHAQVMPEQYRPERIRRQDVQDLLRRVTVRPDASYSASFPQEMHCRL